MVTRRWLVAAVVTSVVSLGACSGGGHQALSSGYVTKANALCGQWTKALNDLGVNPPLSDVNRMVPFTRKQLAIDEGYTGRFKALDATPSERDALAPVYAAFTRINAAEAGVLKSAETGDRVGIQTNHQTSVDVTARLNKQLADLRLKVCAS